MRRSVALLFGLLLLGTALATSYDEDSSFDEDEDIEMTAAPTFSMPKAATIKNFKCATHNTDTDYVFQKFFVSYNGVIPRGSQIQVYDKKGEIASSGEPICGPWIDIKQGLLKAGNCASSGKLDIASQLFYIETPGVYTVHYQELYDVKLGYLRYPGVKIGTVTVSDSNCNSRNVQVGSSAESSEEGENNTVTSSSSSSSSSSSAECSARKGLCTASQNCVGTYYTNPLGCAAGTVCCDGKIRQEQ